MNIQRLTWIPAIALLALGFGCDKGAAPPQADAGSSLEDDAGASTDDAGGGNEDAGGTGTDAGSPGDAGEISCAGPWTITSQPPVSCLFYPNGLVSMRLPNAGNGGPTAHLMPNSDRVVSTLLGYSSNGAVPYAGGGGFLTGTFASPGYDDGGEIPLYIAKPTDPVYKPINVTSCGPVFAPLAQKSSSGLITNLTFHAPSGALYSGYGGGDDNTLTVWDLSGKGISNGKVLGFYTCCGGMTTLPACPGVMPADGKYHAGTDADPCVMDAQGGGNYCSWDDPQTGSGFGGGSAADGSNGTGPFAAMARFKEILSGSIPHAMNANTSCEATAGSAEPKVVFPATLEPGNSGAFACQDQTALAPPNGALFFLDYTDAQLDCMNPARPTCTGPDQAAVPKLNAVQYVFVEQLCHYGWYQSDTGGGSPGGLSTYHNEASEPYLYYSENGFTDPNALTGDCPDCFQTFQTFMNANCSGLDTDPTNWCYTNTNTPPGSAFRWETRIFYGIPLNLSGPACTEAEATADACGVGKHLHIADPCVPVTMAGLQSSGQWSACP
jgi:hypothetical protein